MKIGIIRIDRMGDMALTLPIIKSIKLSNPTFSIDVYSTNLNTKILKNFKYINEIININNDNLKKEKYDLILNFSPGWRSFFLCFSLHSHRKGILIYTSRYKEKFFSKLFIIILSKIFFQDLHIVNRLKKFKNNERIHQTEMMFELLRKNKIAFNQNIEIEKYLSKNNILISKKKICLIHLSSKWINNYYTENNFLELLEILKTRYNLILTSDLSTKNKFKIIFNKFKIIDNYNFDKTKKINDTIIFDNLSFVNWTQAIYSSSLIITPECGCSHIASLCKIPSKIIYDPDNKPDMIYAEYSPWKSIHEKYNFKNSNLNLLLTQNLE